MAFGPSNEQIASGMAMVDRLFQLLLEQNGLLERVAQESGSGLQTIAITEQGVHGGDEVDFPVPGAKRAVLSRSVVGGSFAVTEAVVSLVQANNRRLGGLITNTGEKNLVLLLNSSNNSGGGGIGTITLKPGEHWDFTLGPILWCGSVCAKGSGGETTADVAEV